MFEKIKKEDILFLDIETVAAQYSYENLSQIEQEFWTKKINWLVEKENKTPEELYEKAAIWAEFGKIVCISVGFITNENKEKELRIKSFYGNNEKEILENFAQLLNQHFYKEKHYLCAHNGKEFDFPYIARRMLLNKVPLPKLLQLAGKKPWEVKHLDTLEIWKFGDYKHYTSLNLLSHIFEIPSPKDDIDGSMVNEVYWIEKDLPKIAEYCQKDVITVCKLFFKMTGNYQYDDLKTKITPPFVSS